MVDRLGIEAEPDAVAAANAFQFLQQRLGHDAFAIVAHDDRRRVADHGLRDTQQLAGQGCVEPVARFAVNADHLLLVGDHARLHAGGAGADAQQPAAANGVFGQEALELAGGQVAAPTAPSNSVGTRSAVRLRATFAAPPA